MDRLKRDLSDIHDDPVRRHPVFDPDIDWQTEG